MSFEWIFSSLEVFEVLVEGFNYETYHFEVKRCLLNMLSKVSIFRYLEFFVVNLVCDMIIV